MNAIEHGNQNRADSRSRSVVATKRRVAVGSRDRSARPEDAVAETPDLELKLAGLQTPRGWGLFLIENMVDEIRVTDAEAGTRSSSSCNWRRYTDGERLRSRPTIVTRTAAL